MATRIVTECQALSMLPIPPSTISLSYYLNFQKRKIPVSYFFSEDEGSSMIINREYLKLEPGLYPRQVAESGRKV